MSETPTETISQALTLAQQTQYGAALPLFQKAVLQFQSLGDAQGEARALSGLGNTYIQLADYSSALEALYQSLNCLEKSDNELGKHRVMVSIAVIHQKNRQFERSLKLCEEVIAFADRMGLKEFKAAAMSNAGESFANMGDFDNAIRCLENSLFLCQELGDKFGEGRLLHNIGMLYLNLEKMDSSFRFLTDALTKRRHINDRYGEACSSLFLGKWHHKRALQTR